MINRIKFAFLLWIVTYNFLQFLLSLFAFQNYPLKTESYNLLLEKWKTFLIDDIIALTG
jgi:hypothetical protein